VTGGAGFIGSHLCEALLEKGHSVTAIDDFSTGNNTNLQTIQNDPCFNIFVHDITQLEGLKKAFVHADWVFHLAGRADIVPSIDDPDLYFRCNVQGTLNVLECAREAGVKRLVYAASSSSYGLASSYPTPETAPIAPQYPYALTKHMGEELVLHWAQVYQLPAISLRLFNVYGPRSRSNGTYGAVFGVFLAQKLNKRPFTVVGDGTQTRDFTYVRDVVSAFMAAASADDISGIALNVGSGDHYSVNHLVSLLRGDVVYIPKRPGEPDCTFADVTQIQQRLGWQAQVSFEVGVARMLAHIDDWQQAPLWTPDSIAEATQNWFDNLAS